MAASLPTRFRGLSVILLALVLTAVGVRTYLQSDGDRLLGAGAGPGTIVYIKPRTGVQEIAQTLREAGIIQSRWAFLALAYLQGSLTRLQAGEYEFTPGMSLLEILRKLEAGRVITHQVTIPEGFTAQDIARLLAGERLVNAERFTALAKDLQLVESLDVPGDSLEGYLFPDTYRLTRGMGEEEILRIMVARFHQALPKDFDLQAERLGLDLHSVVTLASLIEKEAKLDRERPVVAAVFHNRLRRNMPLQSDPTAVYGAPGPRRRITSLDLRRKTPYNTYLKAGLPPGPIANPGQASLLAALNPARVSFLYFVAKNDGTHFFSRTLEQHAQAVRKYQARNEASGNSGS
ncbi:MAG: endolytic transglycosylase MltG [candidate division NC10 bacterium]|nr:endolytic transglycosylase MltG [candidate division NC10 bacterium]